MSDLLATEKHPLSHRTASVFNESHSIWLYISEPNNTKIAADCWLLNTIETPESLSDFTSHKSPPPATAKFVSKQAQGNLPSSSQIKFLWSNNGQSVAVIIGSETLGFIAQNSPRGFSKHIKLSGPFGDPFEIELYKSLFS